MIDDLRTATPSVPTTRRGRLTRRLQRREREDQVRSHAVAVASAIAAIGYTQTEIADLLRITARTLRQWRHDVPLSTTSVRLTGRPAARSTAAQRNQVIDYLDLYGPGLGLPPLRDAFPEMTRAELEDLLLRYRRVWRLRHRQPLHVLEWTTPGAVWAMDFAEAPSIIDGIGKYLLAVRDLASGRQLLWHPLREATAAATAEALAPLFVIHGPPLVMKNDNGSPFTAPPVAALLHGFGVTQLFSPPYTPSYNGSIEAGIGSLKARTEAHSARHGRLGQWTCDDVAAARLEANAYARPRGPYGLTPDESWATRPSIAREQRVSFHHAVEDQRCTVRTELQLSDGVLPEAQQRELDRAAIGQALVGLGFLTFSRRSIPPPLPRRKAEVVS